MSLPAQSDLICWLRADTGLFQDNPGTIPATADGDKVKFWTDQSSNGANVTSASDAARPTLKLNILNGQPILRSLGAAEIMSFGNVWGAFASYEGFIVVQKSVDNDTGGIWWISGDGNPHHYAYSDNNIYDGFFSTVRKTVGDPTPTLAAWRLYNCISAAGEWTANLDGTQIFTTATNVVGTRAGGDQLFSGHGTLFPCDIAEVFVYDRKLTGVERGLVGGYIQTRFGLTIAGATSASPTAVGTGKVLAPFVSTNPHAPVVWQGTSRGIIGYPS